MASAKPDQPDVACNWTRRAGIALSIWVCSLALQAAAVAQQALPPMDLHIFMDRSRTVVSGEEDAPNRRLADRLRAVLEIKVDELNNRPLVSEQERLNFYTFGAGVTPIARNISGTDKEAIDAALKEFSEAKFADADKITDLANLLREIGKIGRNAPSDRFSIFLIASDLIHDPNNSSSITAPGICYQASRASAGDGSMLDADMARLSGQGQQSESGVATPVGDAINPNTFFVLLEIEPSEKSFLSATNFRYRACARDLVKLRPVANSFENFFGAVTIKDATVDKDSQKFAELFKDHVFTATQQPLALLAAQGRRLGQGLRLTLTVSNPNRVSRDVTRLQFTFGVSGEQTAAHDVNKAAGVVLPQTNAKKIEQIIVGEKGVKLQSSTNLKVALLEPDGSVGNFVSVVRADPIKPAILQQQLSAELFAGQQHARMQRPMFDDATLAVWEPTIITLLHRNTGEQIGGEVPYPKIDVGAVVLSGPQTKTLLEDRLNARITLVNIQGRYSETTEAVKVQKVTFERLEISDASVPTDGEVTLKVSNSNEKPLKVTKVQFFTDDQGEDEIGKRRGVPSGPEIEAGAVDSPFPIELPSNVGKTMAFRLVYVGLVDHASGQLSDLFPLRPEPTNTGDLLCLGAEMTVAEDGTPQIVAVVAKKVPTFRNANTLLVLDPNIDTVILKKKIIGDKGQAIEKAPSEVAVQLSPDDYKILSNFQRVRIRVLDLTGKACEGTPAIEIIQPVIPLLVGQPKFLPLPDSAEKDLDAVLFQFRLRNATGLPAKITTIRFMNKPNAVDYHEVKVDPPVIIEPGSENAKSLNVPITTPLYKTISKMVSVFFQYNIEQFGKDPIHTDPRKIDGPAKRALRVLNPRINSDDETAVLIFTVRAQAGPLQLPEVAFLRVPGQLLPLQSEPMPLQALEWLKPDEESKLNTVLFGSDRQKKLFKSAIAPIEICVLPQSARREPEFCDADWTTVSVAKPKPILVRLAHTSGTTGKDLTVELVNPTTLAQVVDDIRLNPQDGGGAITRALDPKVFLFPDTASEKIRLQLTDDEANRLYAREVLSVSVGDERAHGPAVDMPLEPIQAKIIKAVAHEIPTMVQRRYHIEATFEVHRPVVPTREAMAAEFEVWLADADGDAIPIVDRRMRHTVQLTSVRNTLTFKAGWVLPQNSLPINTHVYIARQSGFESIGGGKADSQKLSVSVFTKLAIAIMLPAVVLIMSIVSILYFRLFRKDPIFSDLFVSIPFLNGSLFRGLNRPINWAGIMVAIIMFILTSTSNLGVVLDLFGIDLSKTELDKWIFAGVIFVIVVVIFPFVPALIYLATVGASVEKFINSRKISSMEQSGINGMIAGIHSVLVKRCRYWAILGIFMAIGVAWFLTSIYIFPGDVDLYYLVNTPPGDRR